MPPGVGPGPGGIAGIISPPSPAVLANPVKAGGGESRSLLSSSPRVKTKLVKAFHIQIVIIFCFFLNNSKGLKSKLVWVLNNWSVSSLQCVRI